MAKAKLIAAVCAAVVLGLTGCDAAGAAGTSTQRSSSASPAVVTSCQSVTVPPVYLGTDQTTRYKVAGWLCGPQKPADGTIEFLVHGASYDHTYWTGLGHDQYSYVAAAAKDGHPTFLIDALGAGASDRPAAAAVTFAAEASAIHQLVRALRAGTIGGQHWKHVIGVGHSMGAGLWLTEAGTFPGDVDGLLLADFLHKINLPFVTGPLAKGYTQANTRPGSLNDGSGIKWSAVPAGYATIEPRTLFYNQDNVASDILAADEQTATTFPSGLQDTLQTTRMPALSQAIKVPVLEVTGQVDAMGCNEGDSTLSCADAAAVVVREKPFFGAPDKVTAFVLPAAGHDVNLHKNAAEFFAAANRWMDALPTS